MRLFLIPLVEPRSTSKRKISLVGSYLGRLSPSSGFLRRLLCHLLRFPLLFRLARESLFLGLLLRLSQQAI